MINDTTLQILQEKDVPYVPQQWEYVERMWPDDKEKQVRKYLAIMNLCAYRLLRWKDSYMWEGR
jgi:hypothetical protein